MRPSTILLYVAFSILAALAVGAITVRLVQAIQRFMARHNAARHLGQFTDWIHDNQIFAASLVILLCVIIHALATRYAAHPKMPLSIDCWTGRLIEMTD